MVIFYQVGVEAADDFTSNWQLKMKLLNLIPILTIDYFVHKKLKFL